MQMDLGRSSLLATPPPFVPLQAQHEGVVVLFDYIASLSEFGVECRNAGGAGVFLSWCQYLFRIMHTEPP